MKLSLEGLEKERDFYFSKLRDIEILWVHIQLNFQHLKKNDNSLSGNILNSPFLLFKFRCQEADEGEQLPLVQKILDILYATEVLPISVFHSVIP